VLAGKCVFVLGISFVEIAHHFVVFNLANKLKRSKIQDKMQQNLWEIGRRRKEKMCTFVLATLAQQSVSWM
jgi:hypothetical protein